MFILHLLEVGMASNEMKHTGFSVKGGESLNVDGVKTVESFEPTYVTI